MALVDAKDALGSNVASLAIANISWAIEICQSEVLDKGKKTSDP